MNDTVLWIIIGVVGIAAIYGGFLWLSLIIHKNDAKGCISVRQRNDPAAPVTKLVKREDADHVTLKDSAGAERTIIIRDYDPYEIRYPSNAPDITRVSMQEIEIDSKNFKPLSTHEDNPLEDARILARLVKDVTLAAVMRAYQQWAEGKTPQQQTSAFVIIVMLVVVILGVLGGIGFQYYNNIQQMRQIKTIWEGLVNSGLVK